MNLFQARRTARYFLTSWHKNGHGIHPPFVYKLVAETFHHDVPIKVKQRVKYYKQVLWDNTAMAETQTLGAPGKTSKPGRKICDIARSSSIPDKYGALLWRLCGEFKPRKILELGTCLGVSTNWLSNEANDSKLVTIDGNPRLSNVAERCFRDLNIGGCTFVKGEFGQVLPSVLHDLGQVDLAFIDGNHQEEPTLQYFQSILPHTHQNSVIVFDDIHWSPGMERAWNSIRKHPRVTVTIDVCRLGLVFFNNDLSKQDFVIRY